MKNKKKFFYFFFGGGGGGGRVGPGGFDQGLGRGWG